jgi:hypothetical protein
MLDGLVPKSASSVIFCWVWKFDSEWGHGQNKQGIELLQTDTSNLIEELGIKLHLSLSNTHHIHNPKSLSLTRVTPSAHKV